MNHASTVARGRRAHVSPTVCPGVLTPLVTRRHWVHGAAEHIYHCAECSSVIGLVGDTVDWSMHDASWKSLG